MASIILVAVCTALILYRIYKYMFYRPPNFPPGPPRIPFVGSYFFLLLINSKHLHKAALFLSEYYKSKIIGFYIGDFLTIVANDYPSVKEILTRQEYDGRPQIYIAKMRHPELEVKGIFFTDGWKWKEQRRFILRHLRDWGFGCRSQSLEIEIRDEFSSFVELLQDGPKYPHEQKLFRNDGSVICPDIFFATAFNTFCAVLIGERLHRKDQAASFELAQTGMIFQKNTDDYGLLLSIIPWIRHIFPKASKYELLKKVNSKMYQYFKELVDKQIETFNENHDRSVIDLYVKEMKKAECTEIESSFARDQLVISCLDFSFPALTAIAQQLTFMLQHVLINPEIQRKIQAEIEEVVGRGRFATLDDRINLPYTEASLREAMRIETLVPSDLPHISLESTKYFGYDIPSGTVLIPGLHAFHNDKELWGDPEVFRPERFLDEHGKLSLKKDISLPFGAGKRLCAGETFARNTMFLLICAIFQNFNLELPKGTPKPDLTKNETGLITYTPADFYVKFVSR